MPQSRELEARRLVAVFAGRPDALVAFLSGQLGVLKGQAQVLMGLSGLVVTVTGFSGHNMVRGGLPSTIAMIVGIVFVVLAITVTLRVVARLRFVSQDLEDDLEQTTLAVLHRRDTQSRALSYAGVCVTIGLGSYLMAVVLAALAVGGGMSPPPS